MAVPEAVEPYPGTTLRRLVANISTNDTARAGSAVTMWIVCQSPSYWERAGLFPSLSILYSTGCSRLGRNPGASQSWFASCFSIGNVGIFDDGCYSQRNRLHCPAGATRRQIAAGHGVHQNPPSPGRIPKGQEIPDLPTSDSNRRDASSASVRHALRHFESPVPIKDIRDTVADVSIGANCLATVGLRQSTDSICVLRNVDQAIVDVWHRGCLAP